MSLFERMGVEDSKKIILGAVGLLLLVVTVMGTLSYYRHQEEERLRREAEIVKAAAAVIEERMLKLDSAAVRVESSLRRKNINTDLVVAVNVNAKKQALEVVVTKKWFAQPESTQKKMARDMELVLREFLPPDGIPIWIVEEESGR